MTSQQADNILTPEDLENLSQAVEMADEGIRLVDKADSAGIDTGDRKAKLIAARERALRIKQVFFPNV
tara:strand:- start:6147 stop:6350 length:204 start_codon:yes stop_codon:yes gene_type:complete